MKQIQKLLLLLVVLALLNGCSRAGDPGPSEALPAPAAPSEEQGLTLSIASNASFQPDTALGRTIHRAISAVNDSAGAESQTLKLELYDRGVLGSDEILMRGVQAGTLPIIHTVTGMQVDLMPELALLDLPGLFGSAEELNRFIQTEYFSVLETLYREQGLQLLCCFTDTYRELSSSTPIPSAEKLAGLRVRTIDNPYSQVFWQALGAETVPLDFSDVYLALFQGRIDAQDNSLSAFSSAHLYDVQPYVILTNHLMAANAIVMNLALYEQLTQAEQTCLAAVFDHFSADIAQEAAAQDALLVEQLRSESGIEILTVDDQFRRQLEPGREAVIAALRQDLGVETVDRFLAAVDRFYAAERHGVENDT